MSKLGRVVEAVEKYNQHVLDEVKRARADEKFGKQMLDRWEEIKRNIKVGKAPTGLELPRLALPEIDEPGEIARYLLGDGLPGEFPYLNGAYKEMYLEPLQEPAIEVGSYAKNGHGKNGHAEEWQDRQDRCRKVARNGRADAAFLRDGPARRHQQTLPLSRSASAFETTEHRVRRPDALRASTPTPTACSEKSARAAWRSTRSRTWSGSMPASTWARQDFSASMTINGPAPIILAMYIAAAKRRFGPGVVPNLRGTIQADIFKEVQAQNETIFPIEASLRFLGDMIEWTTRNMPRWYPVSHQRLSHRRGRARRPCSRPAYTLSNGFAYVEMLGDARMPRR